jgi:hypothetical protein
MAKSRPECFRRYLVVSSTILRHLRMHDPIYYVNKGFPRHREVRWEVTGALKHSICSTSISSHELACVEKSPLVLALDVKKHFVG